MINETPKEQMTYETRRHVSLDGLQNWFRGARELLTKCVKFNIIFLKNLENERKVWDFYYINIYMLTKIYVFFV